MVKDYYNSRGQSYRIETFNAVLKYVLLCLHVIGWVCTASKIIICKNYCDIL